MPLCRVRCWLVFVMVLLVAGCVSGKKKKPPSEDEVRVAFSKLQEAISDVQQGDMDKLWSILCTETRDYVDKRAKTFNEEFAKKTPEEQAEIAQQYNVDVEELKKKLSARKYLHQNREKFYEKYFLVPGADIDHISFEEGEAIVYYKGDDVARETKSIPFVREDKQWKAVMVYIP